MVVRKRPIRFSMLEYGLITGLDCSNNFPMIVDNMKFYQRHFNGMKQVFLDDVKDRLVEINCEYANNVNLEKVKLACLFFVAGVLWPIRKKKNPPIDLKLMQLVEDLENFNKYPWGTVAFKEVLRSLRKNMSEKEKELIKSKKSKKCARGASYNLSGFLQPLQILAYECIPGIASTFAKLKEGNDLQLPRMCRWMTNKWNKKAAPTHVKIVAAANSSEKDIIGMLTPTADELFSSYYINGEFKDSSPDAVVEKIVELMLQGKAVYCRQSRVDDGASTQPCPQHNSTVNGTSKIHDYVETKSVIMETMQHIDSKLEKMESRIERMELHLNQRFSQLEENLKIVMEHMRKSTRGLEHKPVQKTLKDRGMVVALDEAVISPSQSIPSLAPI
ncbi:uncharacterized protein [Henckelia pumila]|uniref:uncharacterized protein n=1 Tax=Henckelia pumila TaxID=405737 RepID=UPI003C6E3199